MSNGSIMYLINKVRLEYGLAPLDSNRELMVSAQKRAEELCNKPFNHDGWANSITYRGKIGENLAINYDTPEAVTAALVASPKHFANITGDYKHMGAWVTSCENGKVITVQHFGKPYQAPVDYSKEIALTGTILCIVILLIGILRRNK